MLEIMRSTPAQLARLVPVPAPDAHKYTRGVLTVVGGSAAYPGAAALAACAGQRTGAGYTQVFCAPESLEAVRAGHNSLVVASWDSSACERALASAQAHAGAVVIGCGFDAADQSLAALLMRTLSVASVPVLVDGGALSLLDGENVRAALSARAAQGCATVLTPHAGEAARLAAFAHIQAEGAELACALARAYSAVVALKGPQTYISAGESTCYLMDEGTAALAKAGTGDVLAGVIGALLAQGVPALDACRLGAALHAQAGRSVQDAIGVAGVIPEDLIMMVPCAMVRLLAELQDESQE